MSDELKSDDGIKRDMASVLDRAMQVIMRHREQGAEGVPEAEHKLAGDVLFMSGQVAFYQQMHRNMINVMIAASAVNARPDTPNLLKLAKALKTVPGNDIYAEDQAQA